MQILSINGKSIAVIGQSEGLSAVNIIDFEVSDNDLWVVNQKGVQKINVENLPRFNYNPQIELGDIKINDIPIYIKNENSFDYSKNKIQFTVRTQSLQYSNEITYKYKLEGLDNEWQSEFFQEQFNNLSLPSSWRIFVQSKSSLS